MNDFDVGSPMAKAPVFQFKPHDSPNKVSISRTLVILLNKKICETMKFWDFSYQSFYSAIIPIN